MYAKAQDIFDDSRLHEIRITMPYSTWYDSLAQWYTDAEEGADKRFLPVAIRIDGNTLSKQSGVRFKGQYSYSGFPGKKKPFRIHFNKISDKQDYQGIKKINLHNFAGDPSFLREYTSYNLFRHAGIAASRVSYTRLYINNIYWGCYLIVEEPEDKLFLKNKFGTDEGNLFDNADDTRLEWRGNDATKYPEMKLQTKDKAGAWNNLLQWIELFNTYFGQDVAEQMATKFDIGNYLKILALDVYLSNWDSYADNGRNFFIYDNPETGKLHWIPWDYNLAMWKKSLSLFPKDGDSKYNYKPLIWRIHDNEALRTRYYDTICKLLNTKLRTFNIEQRTSAIAALIKKAVEEDTMKFYSNEAFFNNRTSTVTVNMLRNHVPTDVVLPGITSILQARKDTMQVALLKSGCRCSSTGITDVADTYFSIYPNPAAYVLNININEQPDKAHAVDVAVLDYAGRKVRQYTVTTALGTCCINIADLPEGIYLLKIISDNNTSITKIEKLNTRQ